MMRGILRDDEPTQRQRKYNLAPALNHSVITGDEICCLQEIRRNPAASEVCRLLRQAIAFVVLGAVPTN
jgi:hypothetical protein